MSKSESKSLSIPSTYINQQFIEVLSKLNGIKEICKWREIKERFNIDDELLIMIETANELSILQKQSTLFRKKDNANEVLTAVWLGSILKKAKKLFFTQKVPSFTGLNQQDLINICSMSKNTSSINRMGNYLLHTHGIILIYEKSYSGMKVDGVVTKLNSTPVIGMSMRFARYDNYWFTLIHELAHITLHYENLNQVVIDDLDNEDENGTQMETEANRLASDSLISQRIFNKSDAVRYPNVENLHKIASQAQIHPIVAAGLIRNRLNNFRVYSDLVNSINVHSLLEE